MIFDSMFSYSDMNLSDSESEVEFPPPRRVSTAPPPTRHTRYVTKCLNTNGQNLSVASSIQTKQGIKFS